MSEPAFYFSKFEERQPPPPLEQSPVIEFIWQVLASMNLAVGVWYLNWRWCSSLNQDALWFALPLAAAETCAYIGLTLFTFNLWKVADTPSRKPPRQIRDCVAEPASHPERPVSVDVFFPTVSENPELVRLSIRDAKQLRYPHPLDLKIYVLDDGGRDAMQKVAEEEGVSYLTRKERIGFKAGNLANAMEQTSGDFIVICDADTRPLPALLEHTLGYFRDPAVAWVQTPHWYYDLPEGRPLPDVWRHWLGSPGIWLANWLERLIGPVQVGQDPLANNPQMFYDVILRRRNWANASFCCGAGSVHRREAVMEAALKGYAETVSTSFQRHQVFNQKLIRFLQKQSMLDEQSLQKFVKAKKIKIMPYKFHVSEDFYTSILLHGDPERNWKSVLHPEVESKMLSPQDLGSWMVQRFKYAGGTLDVLLRDKVMCRPGLSPAQRLMYAATFWSYLGGIWNVVFLLAPVVYFFTGISPVSAYTADFFKHILPFLLLTELAFMTGTWGLSGFKGKASYLAFFSVNLRALWTVLRGRQIKFPVTPKQRQEGNFFPLILPQFSIALLTLLGIAYAWTAYLSGSSHTLGGVLINTFWGLHNVLILSGLIQAAFWRPPA
ncbi:glycosyltransferase [Candidatus Electronema sp. JC]|uniref:glycosyltransferase family 2 protein n=1 Tax=Candidatus Electronema sp. JC TaxID=3401570 RepID=UPI003B434CCB